MKTHLSYYCLLIATLCLLSSCIEATHEETDQLSYLANREALTKAATEQLSAGVTQTDVEDYLVYRMNLSLDKVQDIVRYDIDNDVYIYVVNLVAGGWYLFSGDYSSGPVLAWGDDGGIDFSVKSSHVEGWLQSIKSSIVHNREVYSEEVAIHRNAWIKAKRFANQSRPKKRDGDPDTSETISVIYIDTLAYSYYSPLTTTYWQPYSPYNAAMPKENDSERCLASCAVVAIAQLLYYTHTNFGFPNDTFEQASCDQYYNTPGTPPYNYVFSIPSTTCWNQMELIAFPLDGSKVAALYALIAKRTGTTFSLDNDGYYSGVTSVDSIAGVLNQFMLLNATKQGYSANLVKNEIANERPVLTAGGSDLYETCGHMFLIDGYEYFHGREVETIYDTDGSILDVNIDEWSYFYYHINAGTVESLTNSQFHFWTQADSYYPYNRLIYVGWNQY